MKIGILGGSFNPIHHGHLLMAELARVKVGLDQVIFMPAACSPYKSGQALCDGRHRLHMIRCAIKGNPYFCASDMELKRGGTSFTIDTLRAVYGHNPKARFFWIIGEDNLAGLKQWKDFSQIIRLASFIAVSRRWYNISSSEIRQRIRQKKSVRYLTPETVMRYIEKKGLYL